MAEVATIPKTHSRRFPNESREYRIARERLLEAERELRDHVEEVAALRRKLPLGGEVREDYVFKEIAANGKLRSVKLSELFEGNKNSLLIYSYMFPVKKGRSEPCPMCTSLIDGYNATIRNLRQRMNFAVVAPAPAEQLREFARERGWNDVRLLSGEDNSYLRDYQSEDEKGEPLPIMNVFHKKELQIFHTWASELIYLGSDKQGQDARHVDIVWPLWNLLDLTPEGRGTNWYPKLRYD